MALILFAGGLLAGAVTQRLTGLGFSLVATPFLVLSFGPWDALGVIHGCGLVVCSFLTLTMRDQVEWPRALQLAVWACLAVLPATWLAAGAQPRVLTLVIGLLLLASLAAVLSLRNLPTIDGGGVRGIAGATCGVVTAVGGTGGPVVSVYARLSRWPHASFAATVQPFFVLVSLVALASRGLVGRAPFPNMSAWSWVVALIVLPLGIALGEFLGRRVPERVAVGAMLVVASSGAITMVARSWTA